MLSITKISVTIMLREQMALLPQRRDEGEGKREEGLEMSVMCKGGGMRKERRELRDDGGMRDEGRGVSY